MSCGQPASSTRLTFIRHAHTSSNGGRHARLSGRTDVPLSDRGRAEVLRMRERLWGSEPYAAIYSSPLRRAWDTALGLQEAGLGQVIACAELEEIDCGELDGMLLEWVKGRHPGLWAANRRQTDDAFRWPGGESYREFRARCLRAVRRLARMHRGERIALVTHAGVISQILGHIHGFGPARWEPFRPGHTGFTEIQWSRRQAAVVAFDDHRHLQLESA